MPLYYKVPRNVHEMFWVRNQPFLAQHGYTLRPRYAPDWKHTWSPSSLLRRGSREEDIPAHRSRKLMDAVRLADNRRVVLRITPTNTPEMELWKSLSENPSPKNHTVPILDVIPIPEEKDKAFVVMPLLSNFNQPDLHCVREVVECLTQILEGLEFMHSRNIAHGDACLTNFMYDATDVCPDGWNFEYPDRIVDGTGAVRHRPRCSVKPFRYYIIDFETTREYPKGREEASTCINRCQITSAPELESQPLNPFRLDVYNVAATFLMAFVEEYTNLKHLRPLLLRMASLNPLDRPTASQALADLRSLVSSGKSHWLDESLAGINRFRYLMNGGAFTRD